MSKTIFYSWQSDLPNATNRGFIEKAIGRAIKEIATVNLGLEVAIDRDTKDVSGTPDIVATIFDKIEKASVFIADVSFIDNNADGRKTPNPNVLVELGFAAKAIGWSRIIFIFNNDFGDVEELPFDLRFRRPLQYSISDQANKSKDLIRLSGILTQAITSIITEESTKEEVKNYLKQQVDTELLTICNHVFKIIYGYDIRYTLPEIQKLVSLSYDDIQRELFERLYLGFTVLKNWESYKQKIEGIINQPFFVQNAALNLVNAVVKVVRCLEAMAVLYSRNTLFDVTTKDEEAFEVASGREINPDNAKDGYVLLRKLPKGNRGVVVDFGTFKQYHISHLLSYHAMTSENFINWSTSIFQLLQSINNWLSITGDEFILDPLTFRMLKH